MMDLNPKIKPSDMKPITCDNCGGVYFRQVLAINKVSKLLTGEAQDSVIPIPTFRCDDCGFIPEEFRPVEQEKEDDIKSNDK